MYQFIILNVEKNLKKIRCYSYSILNGKKFSEDLNIYSIFFIVFFFKSFHKKHALFSTLFHFLFLKFHCFLNYPF